MVSCSFHCSCCGAHFDSLQAFDAHRYGSHETGKRRCREPEKVKKLELVDGKCSVASRKTQPARIARIV